LGAPPSLPPPHPTQIADSVAVGQRKFRYYGGVWAYAQRAGTRTQMAVIVAILVASAITLVYARRARSSRELSSLQQFALESLSAAHPDWQPSRSGANAIQLRVHGQTVDIWLDNILREAGTDRAHARQLLERSVRATEQQLAASSSPIVFAEVSSRLLPVLVPREYAARFGIAERRFVGDISEVLVVDDPDSVRYVLRDDLSRWQLSFEAVEAIALSALGKAARGVQFKPQRPADPTRLGRFVTSVVLDGYDAARLLLPEVRRSLGEQLGYPYFVAIPNRDFLVAWSNDYAFAAEFEARVRHDFKNRNYPISPEVYRVERDSLEVVK
jgi:hypothetical protein